MTSSKLSGTMSLSAIQLSQLLTVLSPEILSSESLEAVCARVVEQFPRYSPINPPWGYSFQSSKDGMHNHVPNSPFEISICYHPFLSRSDAFKIGLALVQLLTQPDLLCGGQHQGWQVSVDAALVYCLSFIARLATNLD